MSKDLDLLLESQYDLFGRISRAEENLKKMGSHNITLSAIETRTKILDQQWEKFDRQHDQVRAGYKDKFKESDYVKADIYETTENTYVVQRGKLDEYKRMFTAALAAPTAPREASDEAAPKTALPRIKLPPFSGAYEDWPTFRDLFLSVIGNNKATSAIERFHYLRSCLQGPAEKLISPLTVTGDNYARAWALLTKHFENKRELIRSNFATFTAVPKMKSDTADELNRIYHAINTAVNAQESIKRPIDSHGMDLFNHLFVELFDPRTRLEWESHISDSSEPPAHETLLDFISKRMLALNAARPKPSSKVKDDSMRTAKTHFTRPGSDTQRCVLCKGKHTLMHCVDFKAKSPSERKLFVETSRLCYNCLGNHLVTKCQSSKSCWTCKSRHHSMLHDAHAASASNEASAHSAVPGSGDQKALLLATARVLVTDRHGDQHTVRVLIDQGSEVSIISEALVQRLRIRRLQSATSIIGVGDVLSGPARGRVTVELASKVTDAKISIVAYVLPRLSAYQGPSTKLQNWTHFQGLPLADPQYSATDPVEILLGAEVLSTILEEGLRKAGPRAPLAQNTCLGWILSGGRGPTARSGFHQSLQCCVDDELVDLVRCFWEQEKENCLPAPLTQAEIKCEEFFNQTHHRLETGRYVVRLPFSAPPSSLASTRKPAERLLSTMERKGNQEARFGDLYRTFMKEYEDLQHMELVSSSPTNLSTVCYLPHHGVLRESSSSTKLRVVFNGSQRTPSGNSLNTYLLIGANLLPSLADVLLRWRLHRYVLVADIEKMYRQILVHPDDRDYQRVLWRHTTTEEIHEYRLNTVTYGLSCAPFLAIRTLRQLASDEGARYPRGAAALQRDCYVDDVVTGASTLEEACALKSELYNLCMAGGFPLRKWTSNTEEILKEIPPEHRQQQSRLWETDDIHSTLGLKWHPVDDSFTFTFHPRTLKDFTKRRVLAETARLFDPLGWLSPIIVRAKILIQSTWLQRLNWDTPLPSTDAQSWRHFLGELTQLNQLRIARWLGCGSHDTQVQIHGFADASEQGYAAVVYLRTSTRDVVDVKLLTAKSKVAPVKPVSLPRLELCAATLLANLVHHVRSVLNMFTAPLILWSDSTVTLHWIQGHASRWKTYVANRVSHIQQKLPEARWRHTPGRDNPADCASRGINPSELIHHSLWWTGPSWLRKDESSWPSDTLGSVEPPEQRAITTNNVHLNETELELLLRYSCLHRLLSITAWCLRWQRPRHNNLPQGDKTQTLQVSELDNALFRWTCIIQGSHYPAEIAAIKSNRPVPNRSQLVKLSPFLDNVDVLRVGGRLKHAVLSNDQRHPMILPPTSRLTQLVIESCHRRTLHGGVQLTLGLFRLRFWVPRGRTLVKKTLHQCVVCTRWRAHIQQPKISDLPRGRVTPARPFLRTGVDYAGPIFLRTSKGRGHRAYKAFIAVFVCFCTKAIHLEVASDYTSEAFLAALCRFISRRSICEEIFSDCGTNFVGADRELRALFAASSKEGRRVAEGLTNQRIQWQFNPPPRSTALRGPVGSSREGSQMPSPASARRTHPDI